MKRYINTKEFFTQTQFTDEFLRAFYELTDSAQKIVLGKNPAIEAFIRAGQESDYDAISFEDSRIDIEFLWIRKLRTEELICPIHKCELTKKSVVMKCNGKTKGMYINACSECRRFYTNYPQEDEKHFNQLEIPYEIIEPEEVYDGK